MRADRRFGVKTFRIEFQIALLALVIAAAVITAGYLAYDSMSRIVYSVHQEAKPDNRLFLFKEINNDLASLENAARLYILSNQEEELLLFDTLLGQISDKLDLIPTLPSEGEEERILTDSIHNLALQKQELWQELLSLHMANQEAGATFSGIYSKLDEQRVDTVTTHQKKKGFFRRMFSRDKTTLDTAYVARSLNREEIKKEVQDLQSLIQKEGEKARNITVLESRLIEENMRITASLNGMISLAEQRKATRLAEKSEEVDRLARQAYRQLAAYSATAVLLLLIALFVLFSYLKKTRAYQKALRDARQKAENLAHAKEQFAANVSHELRTPVNAIAGLTELALQREMEPETKELVTVISKSSQHLKNIINDTLDFSKIEARKIVFDSVDFSPAETCREVLSIQQYEAARKGLALHFQPVGELPGALLGDPVRLKQILLNLIGNAVKFTGEGAVTLRLDARNPGHNKVWLLVTVEDTGPGMSKQDLHVIFDEFVQAKSTSGMKQSGTGLGLYIVKKLVELQGGKIHIESEPGKGTCVKLEIPYAQGDVQRIGAEAYHTVWSPGLLKGISVLVADDDEYNTFLLRKIFQKWGVSLTEAKNGKEAVEATTNRAFDVILMDVHMPEMEGPEAAKIIREKHPLTRIIAVTATLHPEELKACREAGMEHMLIKPFSERELFEALQQVVAPGQEKNPDQPQMTVAVTGEATLQPQKTAPGAGEESPLPPPASIKELENLTDGDPDFLREMITLFITSTSVAREEIRHCLDDGDPKSIFEKAHKIAASCKQIQAVRLYDLVKNLEAESRKESPPETLRDLFRLMETEMKQVHDFLGGYLEGMVS